MSEGKDYRKDHRDLNLNLKVETFNRFSFGSKNKSIKLSIYGLLARKRQINPSSGNLITDSVAFRMQLANFRAISGQQQQQQQLYSQNKYH